MLDQKDFEIYIELWSNPFSSFERIGRRIGLSGTAVRARLDTFFARGFLTGMHVVPSPIALGRYAASAVYQDSSDNIGARELLGVESFAFAWKTHDHDLVVNVYSRSPDHEGIPTISGLIGKDPVEVTTPVVFSRQHYSVSNFSSIDWKITEQLVPNPRTPLSAISKKTGLSVRTVRKHRDHLLMDNQIYNVLLPDASTEPDLIIFGAYLSLADLEYAKKISVPRFRTIWKNDDPPGAYFFGYAENLSEVEEIVGSLRRSPGVTKVSLSVPRGGIFATDNVLGWVRRELEKWKAATIRE